MQEAVIINVVSAVNLEVTTTFDSLLTITQGHFNTNSDTAHLGPNAKLSETSDQEIIGTVDIKHVLSNGTNDAFGGIGLEIDAAGTAPGSTTVTRTTFSPLSGSGHDAINRYFDVAPATNNSLAATVVFHYFAYELNGNTAGSMAINETTDGGTNWVVEGGGEDNGTQITATGVNKLSRFTAIDAATPLAIQLESFEATSFGGSVTLQWSTATETNNYGFYVQRATSQTGPFATISPLIPGAGTSLQEHSYSYSNNNISDGTYYYRIGSQNTTGVIEYSTPIKFVVGGVEEVKSTTTLPRVFALSQNYPNPFNPTTTIAYQLPKESFVKVTLYDALGQQIRTLVNESEQAGFKSVSFDGSNLASGVYFYRINAGSFNDVKKMILLK
jgi:hypothetical protein